MGEETKPRSIDELADLPYSEMTEQEIGIMIEFRAECIARDEEHETRMQMLRDEMSEKIEANRKLAEKAESRLQLLADRARKRYEEASK